MNAPLQKMQFYKKPAFLGVSAILSMVVIGYDRYNVIVKGFHGVKITPGIAFLIILMIWAYALAVHLPPFFGWGGYALGKY